MRRFLRSWVEISLRNVAHNFSQVRALVGPQVRILAAVKANAYGHGMVAVSRVLQECGVDYLGVATVDEAAVLRQAGISAGIIILGALGGPQEVSRAVDLSAALTVCDESAARLINRVCGRGRRATVHVNIDTGMGRLGVWHAEAAPVLRRISRLSRIYIEGLFTHFPSAETDRAFTRRQLAQFTGLVRDLRAVGIDIPLIHAANSSAVCLEPSSHLSMVRPGIMLYGMMEQLSPLPVSVRPVLSFYTRIIQLRDVPAGRSISYGRTYITPQPARLATIAVGYADGYMRALSNRAQVLVCGQPAPVRGRVCMDQTVIEVSHIRNARLGSPVILIGSVRSAHISAEAVARWARTIPYEITCAISSRVQRRVKDN